MKTHKLHNRASRTSFILTLAFSAWCLLAGAATPPRFSITDLGILPGGNYSSAEDVNVHGQVVGTGQATNGEFHAVLFSNGALVDLGALPGYDESFATGIDDAGNVVGLSRRTTEGDYSSFLFNGGPLLDLSAISGYSHLLANGLNEAGVIVGSLNYNGLLRPFVYSNGIAMVLGSLFQGGGSGAGAINRSGAVAGFASVDQSWAHAAVFTSAGIADLGVLPGGRESIALAINNYGDVAGYSEIADQYHSHAFLFHDNRMLDLGTLRGDATSYAYDLNQRRDVVGESIDPTGEVSRAFLYTSGRMYDLNHLIPRGRGWKLIRAKAINGRGQIVGHGLWRGQPRGFLLSPHGKDYLEGRN